MICFFPALVALAAAALAAAALAQAATLAALGIIFRDVSSATNAILFRSAFVSKARLTATHLIRLPCPLRLAETTFSGHTAVATFSLGRGWC